MIKRVLVSALFFLLIIGIVVSGCAAPATPTVTPTVKPTVTPGVTPTPVAPAVKPIKIRLSQVWQLTYPTGVWVEKFKALLEERSGGKITVDHYPSAQLFAQGDDYHAVGTGAVEMILGMTGALTTSSDRSWVVFRASVRYFKSLEALRAFWEEPAGGGYIKPIVEKHGAKVLIYPILTTNLPMGLVSNKLQVKKLEDWKGLKLRAVAGSEWQLNALGASPIPLPNPEVLTAIQTGMVDGAAHNSMTGILAAGWDKVTKYFSTSLHMGEQRSFYPFANLAWWNGLKEDTRAMILKAMEDALRWMDEVYVPGEDNPVVGKMQASYGDRFYRTDVKDPAEFERWRVLIAKEAGKQTKKELPPEMFKLVETKYLR